MWPLEPRRRAVLRVGKHRVELWSPEAAHLRCVSSHSMAAQASASDLTDAVVAVLSCDDEAKAALTQGVDVVLESAWVPLLPLEAGRSLWSRTQMLALLKHRLSQVYGEDGLAPDAWHLQLDYRPGGAYALGYALAPEVQHALNKAASALNATWRSLQPAFAWGWQHFAASRRREATALTGWVWLEQDRALVAVLRQGRVVGCHPAVPTPRDGDEALHAVAREACRLGIAGAETVAGVAGWQVELRLGTHASISTWSVGPAPAELSDASGSRKQPAPSGASA